MRHVFLETNWLVAVARPAHDRLPAACDLLNLAKDKQIRIYVPACCIREAKNTIRSKSQPKEADRLRKYVRWAVEQKVLDQETAEAAGKMLLSFEGRITSELAHLNDTLCDITSAVGVEVVPLSDAMLEKTLELHFKEIDLSEFDRAVLAAVLIKGRDLRDSGERDVNFSTLDSDLWPWEKRTAPSRARPELKGLYDDAGVWVYSDFTLTNPGRPQVFP